jgi:limonene-1,2-epoxide hydrolase
MSFRIENKEQFVELWTNIYNTEGKPDWSHILPYYDDKIHFRDTIQEIRGIKEFKAMTARLVERSKDLRMKIVNILFEGNIIFFEWEMGLSFKKTPDSKVFGASRLTLNDNGKIISQRDYYDLWGDIFDNIPFLGKGYRKFMSKLFG